MIGRCPRLVVAQDLLDTWMPWWETCFICFVEHGARFWKCLRDYFGLSKWRARKMFSRSCLQVGKTEKPIQKEFLTTWKCLNRKKSSQQWHLVSSLREWTTTALVSGNVTCSSLSSCTYDKMLATARIRHHQYPRDSRADHKVKTVWLCVLYLLSGKLLR